MNRRRFLQVGVVGSAVLAAAGAWVVWRDVRNSDTRDPASNRIAIIIGAIAPVLLAGALPADPAQRVAAIDRTVKSVDAVIGNFPASVQQEVADLFRLLDIGIARRVLAGVGSHWTTVNPVEVAAFLERWRTSRIGLLQAGYFALHDLVLGAWYADPASWDAIGYPGPPNVE
jgi:hypothetical protein